MMPLVFLETGNAQDLENTFKFTSGLPAYDGAYKAAIHNLKRNFAKSQIGILEEAKTILKAGVIYERPWTRDGSYNVWFGVGLVWPEIAKDTLRGVVEDWDGEVHIGGMWYDKLIWATGAWAYYRYTGDEEFLKFAYQVIKNTLQEQEELALFDEEYGLFAGWGWADNESAYSAATARKFRWSYEYKNSPTTIKALSTNCVYYNTYKIMAKMSKILGQPEKITGNFENKAESLKKAINKWLWMPQEGHYAYYIDEERKLNTHMEALGESLAILFGVASPEQAEKIFQNQHVTEYGIPVTWPVYPRFQNKTTRWIWGQKFKNFSYHNGAIWPLQQGCWAWACARCKNMGKFASEFENLTYLAWQSDFSNVAKKGKMSEIVDGCFKVNNKAVDFNELYDPYTGEPVGGVSQAWSAAAYLGMIYHGLFGMEFIPEGIKFAPLVPAAFGTVKLENLHYREMNLDIVVHGPGREIEEFLLDGIKTDEPVVPAGLKGKHQVEIFLRGLIKKSQPPEFIYSDVEVDKKLVDSGEPITVSITAQNVGGEGAIGITYPISVDDKIDPAKTLVLRHGEKKKVKFTVEFSESGEHQLSVGNFEPINIKVR